VNLGNLVDMVAETWFTDGMTNHIEALNELDGITAANAAGNDGSGTIAATLSNFTPASLGTSGSPRIRLDGENIWLNTGTIESPSWKPFVSVTP
jgi:hypothetical protein